MVSKKLDPKNYKKIYVSANQPKQDDGDDIRFVK